MHKDSTIVLPDWRKVTIRQLSPGEQYDVARIAGENEAAFGFGCTAACVRAINGRAQRFPRNKAAIRACLEMLGPAGMLEVQKQLGALAGLSPADMTAPITLPAADNSQA